MNNQTIYQMLQEFAGYTKIEHRFGGRWCEVLDLPNDRGEITIIDNCDTEYTLKEIGLYRVTTADGETVELSPDVLIWTVDEYAEETEAIEDDGSKVLPDDEIDEAMSVWTLDQSPVKGLAEVQQAAHAGSIDSLHYPDNPVMWPAELPNNLGEVIRVSIPHDFHGYTLRTVTSDLRTKPKYDLRSIGRELRKEMF